MKQNRANKRLEHEHFIDWKQFEQNPGPADMTVVRKIDDQTTNHMP
jgi:hypothetical protein